MPPIKFKSLPFCQNSKLFRLHTEFKRQSLLYCFRTGLFYAAQHLQESSQQNDSKLFQHYFYILIFNHLHWIWTNADNNICSLFQFVNYLYINISKVSFNHAIQLHRLANKTIKHFLTELLTEKVELLCHVLNRVFHYCPCIKYILYHGIMYSSIPSHLCC